MLRADKINRICLYIQEELDRNIQKKSELINDKEKFKEETESQKEQLEEYKNKTVQKLRIIKIKQKTPGISPATFARLDEMYGEIAEYIDEIDEKINELYDELDEKTDELVEQIDELDEKINELNDLLDGHENYDEINNQPDEKLIRELEEEIRRIDLEIA